MTNPFAPLMAIMIPITMYFGLKSGLNSINNDKNPNDIEFNIKRGKGITIIGIKIIPLIMVIYALWVYFSNEMWNF